MTTYYDDRYRVIQTIKNLYDLAGKEWTTRQVRFDGRVEKEHIRQETTWGNNSVEKFYAYDQADRLLNTRYLVKKGSDVKKDIVMSASRYSGLGQLKSKSLHASSSDPNNFRERLDYSYVPQGWLSKATGQTSAGENFGIELKYTNPANTTAQYNGNVAEMLWKRGGTSWVGYKFSYDGANRLTNGEGISGNNNREQITGYDRNGNITSLNRWIEGNHKDALGYSYNGNQLIKVTDGTGQSDGFNNGSSGDSDDYSYDGVGNAIRDANRGIGDNGIKYNHLSPVQEVSENAHTLRYVYDGTGIKLRMQNDAENTKYAGVFEYNNGNYLTRIATEEGQINVTNNGNEYAFEYYLKDHLGNTRMVIGEAGTMVQETEYFPFGFALPRINGTNKYLYNGKEKQPETGLLDYGARQYDPSIGRWMVVDPMSEKYLHVSPYTYVLNNPALFLDPNGMEIDINGMDLYSQVKLILSLSRITGNNIGIKGGKIVNNGKSDSKEKSSAKAASGLHRLLPEGRHTELTCLEPIGKRLRILQKR